MTKQFSKYSFYFSITERSVPAPFSKRRNNTTWNSGAHNNYCSENRMPLQASKVSFPYCKEKRIKVKFYFKLYFWFFI